ncbi:unnamed protein product [Parajaminaea phylloscopi]
MATRGAAGSGGLALAATSPDGRPQPDVARHAAQPHPYSHIPEQHGAEAKGALEPRPAALGPDVDTDQHRRHQHQDQHHHHHPHPHHHPSQPEPQREAATRSSPPSRNESHPTHHHQHPTASSSSSSAAAIDAASPILPGHTAVEREHGGQRQDEHKLSHSYHSPSPMPIDLPTPPTSNFDRATSTDSARMSTTGDANDGSARRSSAADVDGATADETLRPSSDSHHRSDRMQMSSSPAPYESRVKLVKRANSINAQAGPSSPTKRSHRTPTPLHTDGQRVTPPVSSSRTTLEHPLPAPSERASVLHDAAKRTRHRRKASSSSVSSRDGADGPSTLRDAQTSRSRTPSPILGSILGDPSSSAGYGHLGAPIAGPSAADIQSLLYDGKSAYGSLDSAKPLTFADTSEINAVIAKVEDMGFREEGMHQRNGEQGAVGAAQEGASADGTAGREVELAGMVRKLGQHALEQDAYIRSIEESMHNTRVTAVSVISNLTATHAYEMNAERQLRDRLEGELEGAQASARMLSSLLAKSQQRNDSKDRDTAASVEDEMKWVATLPGVALRKPSAAATAAAAQAASTTPGRHAPHAPLSPTRPDAAADADSRLPQTPSATRSITGLGISETPSMHQYAADYPENVFESPMSAVIAERNKLSADKRYLRNRVRDAEAQLHRLESELKALRPLLVQGGAKALITSSSSSAPGPGPGPSVPTTPSSHRHGDRSAPTTGGSATTPGRGRRDRSRRRRPTTLGDAEAEHLLLAARRLNSVRAQQGGSVHAGASESGSPLKPSARTPALPERQQTPPPRAPSLMPRTPSSAATVTSKTPRSAATVTPAAHTETRHFPGLANSGLQLDRGVDGAMSMPGPSSSGSPRARGRTVLGGGHERADSNASHNGMDELLHAAQSVLTPRDRAVAAQQQGNAPSNYFPAAAVQSKAHERPIYHESPKRRRVSITAQDYDPLPPMSARMLSASPRQRYAGTLHHKKSQPSLGPVSPASRRQRTRTEGADVPVSSQPLMHYHRGGGSRHSEPDDMASNGLSALDLLADQAAASQNPSQSSEPSSSDNEQRRGVDGFSSQEEGSGPDREGPFGMLRARGAGTMGPRTAASNLIAARARASNAPPIAYAHSVAPHLDQPMGPHPASHGPRYPPAYASAGPPRGPTPLSPHMSVGSPLVGHGGHALPPPGPGVHPDGYPRPPPHLAHASMGNNGSAGLGAYSGGGAGGSLPPINTSVGLHYHGLGVHHSPIMGVHGGPPLSAPPSHHHPHTLGHAHHHSLPGVNGAGGLLGGAAPPPPPPSSGSGVYMPGHGPPASPASSAPLLRPPGASQHRSAVSLDAGSSAKRAPIASGPSGTGGSAGPPGAGSTPAGSAAVSAAAGGNGSGGSASGGSKPKGGNTSPDKRLPYVRWTSEEDEKLKGAIAQFGQRWEAVARAVGTRSYHQCRQRALLMRRKGVDPAGGGGATAPRHGGGRGQGGGGSSSTAEGGDSNAGTSAAEDDGGPEDAGEEDGSSS